MRPVFFLRHASFEAVLSGLKNETHSTAHISERPEGSAALSVEWRCAAGGDHVDRRTGWTCTPADGSCHGNLDGTEAARIRPRSPSGRRMELETTAFSARSWVRTPGSAVDALPGRASGRAARRTYLRWSSRWNSPAGFQRYCRNDAITEVLPIKPGLWDRMVSPLDYAPALNQHVSPGCHRQRLRFARPARFDSGFHRMRVRVDVRAAAMMSIDA